MKTKTSKNKKTTASRTDKAVGSGPLVRLLDCPFCGAAHEALDKRNGKGVYAYENAPSSDMQTWLHVVCLECGGAAPSVQAWNTRPNAGDKPDDRPPHA